MNSVRKLLDLINARLANSSFNKAAKGCFSSSLVLSECKYDNFQMIEIYFPTVLEVETFKVKVWAATLSGESHVFSKTCLEYSAMFSGDRRQKGEMLQEASSLGTSRPFTGTLPSQHKSPAN